MNSLRKLAAFSALVGAIALIISIVLAPFALSSAITLYNDLMDKAEANPELFNVYTTLDPSVETLTLMNSVYFYDTIKIEQSPDNSIHILTKDRGFERCEPIINQKGSHAELQFNWKSDPQLDEDNLLQALYYSVEGYDYSCTIQLPTHVSLQLDEEFLENSYYSLRINYSGFANYPELKALSEQWEARFDKKMDFDNYHWEMEKELEDISRLREGLQNQAQYAEPDNYLSEHSSDYSNIKNRRSDLLKRNYNLRKELLDQDPEEMDAAYLEQVAQLSELCAKEQEYDLLTVQQHRLEMNSLNSQLDVEDHNQQLNEIFDRQVELDLEISRLRDSMNAYLQEDLLELLSATPFNETVVEELVAETDPEEPVVETQPTPAQN